MALLSSDVTATQRKRGTQMGNANCGEEQAPSRGALDVLGRGSGDFLLIASLGVALPRRGAAAKKAKRRKGENWRGGGHVVRLRSRVWATSGERREVTRCDYYFAAGLEARPWPSDRVQGGGKDSEERACGLREGTFRWQETGKGGSEGGESFAS
ncbi:hypothetical protein TRVL_04712 [Trypanosoma vivax]|nr:hypothetical protein TRVL_04712 [Trypanosoma vivax]